MNPVTQTHLPFSAQYPFLLQKSLQCLCKAQNSTRFVGHVSYPLKAADGVNTSPGDVHVNYSA